MKNIITITITELPEDITKDELIEALEETCGMNNVECIIE